MKSISIEGSRALRMGLLAGAKKNKIHWKTRDYRERGKKNPEAKKGFIKVKMVNSTESFK